LPRAAEPPAAEPPTSEATPSSIAVPASDRVVTLDDNAPDYKQSMEVLAQTIEAVRVDNQAEDREERLAELEAGKRLLQAPRARLEAIRATLIAALKDLMKETRSEAIKTLAKAALAAFVALFHLIF
jgi:hypothetical protein